MGSRRAIMRIHITTMCIVVAVVLLLSATATATVAAAAATTTTTTTTSTAASGDRDGHQSHHGHHSDEHRSPATTATTTNPGTVAAARERLGSRKGSYVLEAMSANLTMVEVELAARGYVAMKSKRISPSFKWSWSPSRLYPGAPARQITNHFASVKAVGDKAQLAANIEAAYGSVAAAALLPRSYDLSVEAEVAAFELDASSRCSRGVGSGGGGGVGSAGTGADDSVESGSGDDASNDDDETGGGGSSSGRVEAVDECVDNEEQSTGLKPRQASIDGSGCVWIHKPAAQARGVGITVHASPAAVLATARDSDFGAGVVQKYIESPLLLGSGSTGHKFDIRQFVLVTSLDPLEVYVFDSCYLRIASQPFSLETSELSDLFAHLTNHQVQKESQTLDALDADGGQWSCERFADFVDSLGRPELNYASALRPAMVDVIVKTLGAWPSDDHRNRTFELLGFDLMVDDSGGVWLIEVNDSPGLYLTTDTVTAHHTSAIASMMDIILSDPQWNSNTTACSASDPSRQCAQPTRPSNAAWGWTFVCRGSGCGDNGEHVGA